MVLRRVLGTILAGTLALGGLQASPAFADPGTTRTFFVDGNGVGELCKTANEVTYSAAGAITIDVGKLDPGISEVVIETGSLSGCIDKITSLNWTGTRPLDKLTVHYGAFSQNNMVSTLTSVSFPAGLASLQLDGTAFWQYASTAPGSMGPNTLASVTFPEGLKSLTIGSSAFGQEATLGGNALKSLTFPDSLTDLAIDDFAFWQYAPGANALESVHFGDGLTSLTVGDDAFYQYSSEGDSALSSVTFPAGLTSLELGNQAFVQSAPGGETALDSIDFPSGLTTLTIGDQAFLQYGPAGGTLETVRFPGTLTSLTIGVDAFRQQNGISALKTIIFDRTQAWPAVPAHTLAIDAGAFTGATPTWYWFGPDGTDLAAAWNGTVVGSTPNPTLVGYRILAFDTGAGGPEPGTWYVYRGGRHTTEPRVVGEIRAGTWTVPTLPTATRSGYDLAGWCATAGSPCPSLLLVGDSFTVTGASMTLHASWTLLPPVPVSPARRREGGHRLPGHRGHRRRAGMRGDGRRPPDGTLPERVRTLRHSDRRWGLHLHDHGNQRGRQQEPRFHAHGQERNPLGHRGDPAHRDRHGAVLGPDHGQRRWHDHLRALHRQPSTGAHPEGLRPHRHADGGGQLSVHGVSGQRRRRGHQGIDPGDHAGQEVHQGLQANDLGHRQGRQDAEGQGEDLEAEAGDGVLAVVPQRGCDRGRDTGEVQARRR